MKKITILLTLLLIAIFGNLTAQRHLIPKEIERTHLQSVKPIEHHFDQLRNVTSQTLLSEDFNSGSVPATWTVVSNIAGSPGWTVANDYNGQTLDGTPFAFIDSDSAGHVDIDTELISPEIDASAVTSLFISFEQFFNSYSGIDVGDVDVYDGTQWVNVYTTSSDVGAWGNPDRKMINVSAYKNAHFKVRFHYYNANWDWYWAVDNVKVFVPNVHDLAVTNALPETFLPNISFILKAFVYNNSSSLEDNFDVTFDIKDASNTSVFNETVSVSGANLNSGENYEVSSTNYATLAVGVYTLDVSVSVSGDEDTSNDVYTTNIYIIDYTTTYNMNTVYSYVTWDGDNSGDVGNLVTFDINNGDLNPVLPLNINDSFTTGTFVNDVLVGIDGNNNVYLITGAGEAHKYGILSGDAATDYISGIAYDSALGELYITNGVDLLSVDLNTLNTTTIGSMNLDNSSFMVGMDVDNNGNMYGINIGDDKLYSIDPTTGAASAIGALWMNIEYAQDISADPTTGNLYGTLFQDLGNGSYASGLYAINKTSGSATLIGNSTTDEYTLCAIKGTTVSISENTIEGLNVYPNPTNGMILVNAKENIENISVINIAGQEVMKVNNNGLNAQLDLSNLTAGSYILKITTDKTVATYQVIKK